jgi:tryptophanyl-tRNA synthetase
VSNSSGKEIDYQKLLKKFGCFPVNEALVGKLEKMTGVPVHRFIRRGIFYAHRDLDMILEAVEKHK